MLTHVELQATKFHFPLAAKSRVFPWFSRECPGGRPSGKPVISALKAPISIQKKTKLVDACRTRWVERIDGLNTFNKLFVPLFHLLEKIRNSGSEENNKIIKRDALSYSTLILQFDLTSFVLLFQNGLQMNIYLTSFILLFQDGLQMNIYLTSFVLLFQDGLQISICLTSFVRLFQDDFAMVIFYLPCMLPLCCCFKIT